MVHLALKLDLGKHMSCMYATEKHCVYMHSVQVDTTLWRESRRTRLLQ